MSRASAAATATAARPRVLLPLALVLLLCVPAAAASPSVIATPEHMSIARGPSGVYITVAPAVEDGIFRGSAGFLVAGVDNVLNISVNNQEKSWWNATFRVLNVTGATAGPANGTLSVSVPPHSSGGALLNVHPESVGQVQLELDSGDTALTQTGEPWTMATHFWAVPPVAVRFLDPPPYVPTVEGPDGTYRKSTFMGSMSDDTTALVRLRPGETITPRIEVENLGATTAPAFELTLSEQKGAIGTVQVAPLEPGETREIELPEFDPDKGAPSGRSFGGPGHVYAYRLTLTAAFGIGSATAEVTPADFQLRNGAVVGLRPAAALVEVRQGFAIDLLMPESFQLGAPTRIRYNVTSYDSQVLSGTLLITLNTPGGLHYSVQGPETQIVTLSLPPGAVESGAFEFTPRVTGTWNVQTVFRTETSSSGMGGNPFEVPGSVNLRLLHDGAIVFARMGEPVTLEVLVQTQETLEDARLNVASMTQRSYSRAMDSAGTVRPGLAHRLLETSDTTGGELGTLRPGGDTVATLEVLSHASGSYSLVPYVEAGGFAYTSAFSSSQPAPSYHNGLPSTSMVQVAVQPRTLSSAWGIMPLALGLALFVGTWTLRTRFVK